MLTATALCTHNVISALRTDLCKVHLRSFERPECVLSQAQEHAGSTSLVKVALSFQGLTSSAALEILKRTPVVHIKEKDRAGD